MLAHGIHFGLNGVIEDFLKNHDRLEEEHLIIAAEAAEKCKVRGSNAEGAGDGCIPEDAAFLTHDNWCCIQHARAEDDCRA